MFLARVVGTVVATQKDQKLEGGKLLICQQLDMKGEPKPGYVVAMDAVGAGRGEVVIYAAGSSARLTDRTQGLPVDSAIIAIVDSLEYLGDITYQKGESD